MAQFYTSRRSPKSVSRKPFEATADSLSQDAGVLTRQGFHLQRLGILDMFPHTYHLESMALFTR